MRNPTIGRRRRSFKILRLFFALVFSFLIEYWRARFGGRSYDFFQDSVNNRKRAVAIRNAALELGGVLIKVGQFLSSRVDLLPTEYIEELALLQDEVPGVPFPEIREAVERELDGSLDEIFLSFDRRPLAAASLGQVHAAQLRSGAHVAVKVQRPQIDQIVEADLASLRYIVRWLDRYTAISRRVDLRMVLREFEDTLRLELDYQSEAHHAERLGILFADDPRIAVPRVYWSHSTGRILTLQYMWGTKVTDFEGLQREGISRSALAEILMQAYLRQVLEAGFFHADPHPGNIFVRPGPVVVFLDFGMVGEMSPGTREYLRDVFLSVIRRDFDGIIDALERLGFVTQDADRIALRRALIWTVDNFYELSFGELKNVDPRDVLNQLQDVLFSQSVRIPPNYAFLGRALGTLSGLCTALDPSFQFFTVAEPYARRLVSAERGVKGTARYLAREARSLAATTYTLPFLSRSLLEKVGSGELEIRQFEPLVHAVDRLERTITRIIYSILMLAFLLAGSLAFRTHERSLAVAAFVVTFIFLVGVMFPFRRRK